MRISIVQLPLCHGNLGDLDAFVSSFEDVNEFPDELIWCYWDRVTFFDVAGLWRYDSTGDYFYMRRASV